MICHNKNLTYQHNNTKPTHDATASYSNKNVWDIEDNEWISEKCTIKDNVYQVFSYIWGEFSPGIKVNIEGLEDYEKK